MKLSSATVFTVRRLFYIQGQAPKAFSSAVSSSERRKTGKGLGKGLPRAWPLVANQAFFPGCLSIRGLCLNLTTDKDLLEHKLLVTNCVVTLGKRTWRVLHSLHAVHSVMQKGNSIISVLFVLTYLYSVPNSGCKDLISHSLYPSFSLRHAVYPPAPSLVKL